MKKLSNFCYYALSLLLIFNSVYWNNSLKANAEAVDIFKTEAVIEDFRTIDKYVICGNYTSLSENELKNLLADQENIYIFYDLDTSDNTDCAELLNDANAVVYFYQNGIPSLHRLQSETTDKEVLLSEIDEFVTEKINLASKKENQSFATATQEGTTVFKDLFDGSFRKINKPYGYIDCNFTIKKYRTNDVSSLYLLETDMAFTPGQTALDNDTDGYGNWYNKAGYLHIKANRSFLETAINEYRYGGTPVFKEAYPINSPGTVSIGSTYSSGVTMGYSFKNGFSLTNVSLEQDFTLGANIVYEYNKVYTNTEPAFSAQKNADDVEMYEWNYTYAEKRAETNHLKTGFLYEMNNSGHDMREGNVMIRFEYSMTVEDANENPKKFSYFNVSNFDTYIPKSDY